MKARMPAGFGRPDMNALMRQAQKMQDDMKANRPSWKPPSTPAACRRDGHCQHERQARSAAINIKPEAVDPDDVEMLEDMVAAAINATVKQVDETAEAEMGKLTGGMNIPGL